VGLGGMAVRNPLHALEPDSSQSALVLSQVSASVQGPV
jgi:hypothetical protein